MFKTTKLTFATLIIVLLATLVPAFKSVAPINIDAVADVAVNQADEKKQTTQSYNCKSAVIMDNSTGQILFEQNAGQRLPIASMVKIMTLNIAFKAVRDGRLKLDDMVTVSQYASSMGGSQAFLDAGLSYSVDELLKSIIIASANDACVAIAEHLMGSDTEFILQMNQTAAQFGMKNTNFVNCTGLPADGQYSCASDAAIMFRELIKNEHFFNYSKIWMYDLAHPDGRTTSLTNTNKLVRFYNGCDGGKTGFTKEALSCLAATAKRGDTRLIAVAIAAPSAKERNAEVTKMLNYGFANFETQKVIGEDSQLDAFANVDGGKQDKVALKPANGYYHLIKKGEKPKLDYTLDIQSVRAPIKTGDTAGKITILLNGEPIANVDLIAAEDVKKATYLDNVNDLINKW